MWVAALQPSTYDIAADKGIGVLAFGSSAPSSLEPYVKAYKERVKNATPVGAFINDQWASSTLGVCLENGSEPHIFGTMARDSSHISRLSLGSMPMPVSSYGAERPVPKSTRPSDRWSSIATRSATLFGWW